MTSTSWLVETILPGSTFFLVQDISETWTKTFDASLQLNKRAVFGDVCDPAFEFARQSGIWLRCRPKDRSSAASCRG